MKLEKMNLPDSLAKNLNQVEKRWLNVQSSTVLLLSLTLFFSSLVVLYLSDRLWDTSPYVRVVLLAITIVSFVTAVLTYLKRKADYTRTPFKLIKLVQRRFNFLGDSLEGAVELSVDENRPSNISPELCTAAIKQVAESTSKLDFTESVETANRNRFARYFGALALVVIVFMAIDSRALINSIERWINPFSSQSRYTFVQLNEMPDQMVVLHGESFSLNVSVKEDSRIKPTEINWNFSGLSEEKAELKDGKVSLKLPGQTQLTTLTVSAYDFSKEIVIKPVHRPAITEIFANITMPEYLKHKDIKFEVQGNSFEVIQGSKYNISGKMSNELYSIQVYKNLVETTESLFDFVSLNGILDSRKMLSEIDTSELGEASLTSSVNGNSFSTDYSNPAIEESLFMIWKDKNGFTQKEPFELTITPIEDDPPFVDAQNMSRTFALLVTENVVFPVKAEDNFGVKYIKAEYEVQGSGNQNFSKTFKLDIKDGGTDVKNLETQFIFSPNQLNIPKSSTVKLRLLTNDYLPGRKDVLSPEYKIYILSKEEHSKLIQERFEALTAKMEGVAMQEDENMQKNIMTSEMSPDELNSEKGKKAIEEALEAEKANAQRLKQMIDEGMELVKEALKNDEFNEEQLQEWTEMLEELEELAEEDMEKVQGDLAQASQAQDSKKSPLRLEGLKSAIKKQEEILRQMRRLSKELDEDMKKAALRNFAARLRNMSKDEKSISTMLQELFVKSVGMSFEDLPDSLKALNDKILLKQKTINKNILNIKLEMVSFYARTKIEKYREVTDDMETKKADEKLKELVGLIEINKTSSSIKPANEWAKQFEDWADMLDPKNDDENDPNKPEDQEPKEQDMKFLMALVRVIEQEQNLYEETKFLEDKKSKLKKEDEKGHAQVDDAADKLAERQKANLEELKKLTVQVQNPKVKELMEGAENAMDEAQRSLDKGETGVKTQAAESAAIELLISIFTSNGGQGSSSSAMMAMLQGMIGQGMGMGNSPGGNNSGGQAEMPTEVNGNKTGENPDAKNNKKHSTLQLEDIPVEFREALESYYKEVEEKFEK